MKKMMILTTIAAIVLSAGCTKVKDLANISVNIPYSTQVTVPQIPGDTYGVPIPGTSLTFPTIAVATNSQQYISEYHTSSSKIVSVDLSSLSIQILMPPNQNFDFLDTVQLYISTPSLPEVLVAYQYNIMKGQTGLNFVTMGDLDLKNYFLADTMYFTMRAHINAIPRTGTQLNIATSFHMIANPLD